MKFQNHPLAIDWWCLVSSGDFPKGSLYKIF